MHGELAAQQALAGARAAFADGQAKDEIPTLRTTLPRSVVDLLVEAGLCSSKGDARRQIKGGGVKLGAAKVKVTDMNLVLGPEHLEGDGAVALWRGKKSRVQVTRA